MSGLSSNTVRLVEVNVGKPRTLEDDEPWTTGFFKVPVSGPVALQTENLQGDGQADLKVHGGPDKAVCVYSADHYPRWQQELGVRECGPGWFGENFSLQGQSEGSAAIGDVYRIGTALVQVSQPRAPCWKLARRWSRPDMPKLVIDAGRTGWYLRVLEPGIVARGQTLTLVERPFPQWTIEVVNDTAYSRGGRTSKTIQFAKGLSECDALADGWRHGFKAML